MVSRMKLIDLFFPRDSKCIFCNRETSEYGICNACYLELPLILSPSCDICGGNLIGSATVCLECKNRKMHFDKCYSVLEYRDDVQIKIITFKQKGAKHIGLAFSHLIAKKFEELEEDIDIIIPVPIHEARLKERGYNQSEVLCNILNETGKVRTDILLRTVDTPHQTGLSRENRQQNLEGAFVITDKRLLKDKTILLVDDIYTTGSTLNECAKTLRKYKPKKIIALCLARTPIKVDRIIK